MNCSSSPPWVFLIDPFCWLHIQLFIFLKVHKNKKKNEQNEQKRQGFDFMQEIVLRRMCSMVLVRARNTYSVLSSLRRGAGDLIG